jgi:hypothetical protein
MSVALAVLALIVALALLWAGVRKLSWATPLHAVLSALDLLALALALMQLGWVGLALFLGVNIAGFLAWGTAGAIYVDAELASAAALGSSEKSDMRALSNALEQDQALKVLGPRRRANLIRLLSERARTPSESRQMAGPIGLLWIIGDKPDLAWLVERFDSLLRLYDKPSTDAMDVADMITVSSQQSAATQNEMIEALVIASGGTPTPSTSTTAGTA